MIVSDDPVSVSVVLVHVAVAVPRLGMYDQILVRSRLLICGGSGSLSVGGSGVVTLRLWP